MHAYPAASGRYCAARTRRPGARCGNLPSDIALRPTIRAHGRLHMPSTYNVMIMGASYGSLLATKLLFAGHKVKLVCLPAEAEVINQEGTRVRLPIKGKSERVEIDSRKLPGQLSADVPTAVNPADYDLVALAMQEPQYRAPGVRDLLAAVAKAN